MGRHVVGRVRDFPAGTRRIVDVEGVSIGVFNVHGSYYALRSSCPHQGAPLCLGRVMGTTVSTGPFQLEYAREGEIIKCPWHGWEFDILTGRSVFNPHRVRVRRYEVTVEPEAETKPESKARLEAQPETGAEPEPEDPSIPTYPVTIEDGLVILHV
jgi:3-phenylpropionate/trans-cinnamate dioxygenase ferredoxin subunit